MIDKIRRIWVSTFYRKPLHRQIGKVITDIEIQDEMLTFHFEVSPKPTMIAEHLIMRMNGIQYSDLIGRKIVSVKSDGPLVYFNFDKLYVLWFDQRDGLGTLELTKD